MAILFFVLLIIAIIFRVYRLKQKQASPPASISEINISKFDNVKSILNDTSKWSKYSSTYDEEIVKKRRKKFIATYNELITRQSLQEYTLTEWTKFTSKIQNISINPAKVFRSIIFPLIFGLSSLSGFAQSAKSYINDGNDNYKSKNYSQALIDYNHALSFSMSPEKLAGVHYKIAVTFNKLKNCDSAKVHYVLALKNDPQNGGASSISKFEDKLRDCNLSKSDIEANNNNQADNTQGQVLPEPDRNNEAIKTEQNQSKNNNGDFWLFLFIGIPFILLASWIIAKIIGSILFKISPKQKRLDLDGFINDDLFWPSLSAKGYQTSKIEEVREVLKNAANNLTTNSSDLIVSNVHRHIYWIKNNPELYFTEDALTNGNLRYLLRPSELDFYCFFTAEQLPEGKSNALIIKHPSNSSLDKRVWVSDRILRMIEKKSKIKVRLHAIDGVFTHWSNDKTYYNKFKSHIPLNGTLGNFQSIEKWVGEMREIDLNKYYEIFTNPFQNYIFPHPDAIIQGYIDYLGDVSENNTGFDRPTGTYQQGDNYTSNSGSDLLTGVVIGSMLSDHDRNRYDEHGHPLSDVS